MKLTTLKGELLLIKKQTRHAADYSKRGTLVRVKQTRHEAEHPNRGDLVIINRGGMMLTNLTGSFGNYIAEGA